MLAHSPFLLVQLFTIRAADSVQDDKTKMFATVENPPPLNRTLEIRRCDAVISRLLRKLCFSDVIYLVL